MRVLTILAVAALSTAASHIYFSTKLADKELQLVEAQGDAAFERERAQKLLSGGRWVRTYDERNGISTYRFAARKEQR
jgi:hypothetical protein